MRITKRCLIPLLLGCAAPALAAPPPPDLTNLPQYEQSLRQSADPQAAVFLREIAAGPADLKKAEGAARAAGITLDLAAAQRPLPAPEVNGAAAYQQVKALLDQETMGLPQYADPLNYGYTYTAPQIAAARQVVAAHHPLFTQIHHLAQMTTWDFPHNWSQGAPMASQVVNLEAQARALNTESYLLAQAGDMEAATQNQALGMEIGLHVASTPLPINFIAAVVVDNTSLSGFKNLLYMSGPNAAVAASVQKAITANAFPLSLTDALIGDLSFEVSRITQFPATVAATQTLNAEQATFAANLTAAAEAHCITTALAQIQATTLAEPQRRIQVNALVQATQQGKTPGDPVEALDDSIAASDNDPFASSYNSPNSANPIPDVVFLMTLEDRVHAQERVTLIAAAALAAKAQTGAYPGTLPLSLTDPFSGQPLLYRKQGDSGFVVYSVGPSGQFDGNPSPQFNLRPSNAFFQYPAPPPQPVTPDMLTLDE